MAIKAFFKSAVVDVPTAGTAVPLSSTANWVTKAIITAPSTNTTPIYLGDSTVDSSSGIPVAAGDQYTLEVKDPIDQNKLLPFNLADVYVDAGTNGDDAAVGYYEVQ